MIEYGYTGVVYIVPVARNILTDQKHLARTFARLNSFRSAFALARSFDRLDTSLFCTAAQAVECCSFPSPHYRSTVASRFRQTTAPGSGAADDSPRGLLTSYVPIKAINRPQNSGPSEHAILYLPKTLHGPLAQLRLIIIQPLRLLVDPQFILLATSTAHLLPLHHVLP